jgi:hypothetical protein
VFTNVNLAAPIGAIALLAAGVLFLIAVFVLVLSLMTKRRTLTKLAAVFVAVIGAAYLIALLGFSFASREELLARGSEKYFCEIDCHLAYSIIEVHDAKTIGEGPHQVAAAGIFRVVTIQTRFDENTIGRQRGDALLYPNSRVVSLTDAGGTEYFPVVGAQQVLDATQAAGTTMTIPLRPGERYSTVVVFDLPPDVQKPTLLIREGETLTHLVIGHENSPLHKKVKFLL